MKFIGIMALRFSILDLFFFFSKSYCYKRDHSWENKKSNAKKKVTHTHKHASLPRNVTSLHHYWCGGKLHWARRRIDALAKPACDYLLGACAMPSEILTPRQRYCISFSSRCWCKKLEPGTLARGFIANGSYGISWSFWIFFLENSSSGSWIYSLCLSIGEWSLKRI